MKANYNITGNDRKALVAAIEKLTGDKAVYMRMPTCAYEIGDITVDKEGGVNINDCVDVNHALSDALDADDFIEDAYYLEVSSPGLGRALKKDSHLEKSIGMEVELKTYKPIDKVKEFSGILKGFNDKEITVEIDGEDRSFNRQDIALIKLALDL